MSTIHEVSRIAGVSTATVSRVLNNVPGVKETTRQHVLNVIKDLNYHPSSIGRNLRLRESRAVMVVIPDITNPFFSGIVQSIDYTAHQNGYDVILFNCSNGNDVFDEIGGFITAQKVDGVIFLSSKGTIEQISALSERCTVVVACEYVNNVNIPSVSVDNIAAAIEATNYLISLGHRDILFINPWDRDRLRGYTIALEQAHIPVKPELQIESGPALDGGYSSIEHALENQIHFTAAFCSNDLAAIGAIKAIRTHGLSVPDDVSVIGFDGLEFGRYVEPSLTTISQPVEEIGFRAMELWMKLQKGDMIDYPVRVKYDLTIRGSCGPIRTSSISEKKSEH